MDYRVLEVMTPYFLGNFGNAASRTHVYGKNAEDAVESARETIAKVVKSQAKNILFTSGATESNNLIISGLLPILKNGRVVTVRTEHSSVLEPIKSLERQGIEVIVLDVDQDGFVNLDELESLLMDPKTKLLSLMWANNEIGIIHPIEAISKLIQKTNVLFHCDATQALGKVNINFSKYNIHFASFSAHKIYGPKGVGAFYVQDKSILKNMSPLLRGGDQEDGFRPGTQNVPGIVGFGRAAELCQEDIQDTRFETFRNTIYEGLLKKFGGDLEVNGYFNALDYSKNKTKRLACNLNFHIKGLEAEGFFALLKNTALSSGSACHSHAMGASHVITALHPYDENRTFNSIRLSVGRTNLDKDNPKDILNDIFQTVDHIQKCQKAC